MDLLAGRRGKYDFKMTVATDMITYYPVQRFYFNLFFILIQRTPNIVDKTCHIKKKKANLVAKRTLLVIILHDSSKNDFTVYFIRKISLFCALLSMAIRIALITTKVWSTSS